MIHQGDEGDYFYILSKGSCSVTRKVASNGWEVPLAELSAGDCFGEEALVSEAKRNATITMLTDGTLMRLSKRDFLELLKKPMVHYVDYERATTMVKNGGTWLDVRVPEEHARQALKGSFETVCQAVVHHLLRHGAQERRGCLSAYPARFRGVCPRGGA